MLHPSLRRPHGPAAAAFALFALLAAGCGGGGAASGPPEPTPLEPVQVERDLGIIPAHAATAFVWEVESPFATPGTVAFESLTGPLTMEPTVLPAAIDGDGTLSLPLVIHPTSEGTIDASVRVRIAADGTSREVIAHVRGEAVGATLEVPSATIDFGDVLPGTLATRSVLLRNSSSVSSVTVSGVSSTHPAFVSTSAMPIVLGPGATANLGLRYNASSPGTPQATFTVSSNATNGPHGIPVFATTGGEEVVGLGSHSFDGSGNTAAMTFDVPADAISFTIEASASGGTQVGLRRLTGPDGTVYENDSLTGPYIWEPDAPVFVAQVPNTDRADVQLVPGGGTYTLRLLRWIGSASSTQVRVLIERRPRAGTQTLSTLDLNVFLASAIEPTAATAAGDATLQAVLSRVDTILQQQGVRVGDVDYYDVTNPAYDDVTEAEFGPMLTLSSGASERRLNLFFVRTAIGGGVLGVSAALGGPALNGTSVSGVMSLYSTTQANLVGLVAAHEIGHFLGLAHTVESSQTGGFHDDIEDTAECPSSGTNAACPTAGGGYLMHWQAVGGTTVTDGQGLVVRGHALLGPRALPPGGLSSKPLPFLPSPALTLEVDVAPTWCGTCSPRGKTE